MTPEKRTRNHAHLTSSTNKFDVDINSALDIVMQHYSSKRKELSRILRSAQSRTYKLTKKRKWILKKPKQIHTRKEKHAPNTRSSEEPADNNIDMVCVQIDFTYWM